MKAVSEYVIGNTAVRIVDTGRRIRVIDIEKEKERKQFKKTAVATILAAALSFATSLSVVSFHNSQTLLDKQIFTLRSEIDSLERENKVLEKENEEKEKLSYAKVLKRATALGMSFPTKKNVKTYTYRKGSGIKFYMK